MSTSVSLPHRRFPISSYSTLDELSFPFAFLLSRLPSPPPSPVQHTSRTPLWKRLRQPRPEGPVRHPCTELPPWISSVTVLRTAHGTVSQPSAQRVVSPVMAGLFCSPVWRPHAPTPPPPPTAGTHTGHSDNRENVDERKKVKAENKGFDVASTNLGLWGRQCERKYSCPVTVSDGRDLHRPGSSAAGRAARAVGAGRQLWRRRHSVVSTRAALLTEAASLTVAAWSPPLALPVSGKQGRWLGSRRLFMRVRPVRGEPASTSERPSPVSSARRAAARSPAPLLRAQYALGSARAIGLTVLAPRARGRARGQPPEAPPRARLAPLGAVVGPASAPPPPSRPRPPADARREPFPDGQRGAGSLRLGWARRRCCPEILPDLEAVGAGEDEPNWGAGVGPGCEEAVGAVSEVGHRESCEGGGSWSREGQIRQGPQRVPKVGRRVWGSEHVERKGWWLVWEPRRGALRRGRVTLLRAY